MRIIIDAGHGGKDPGADNCVGVKEKDVTLDLARRTKKILKQFGFNVYLTRNEDKDLSLLERSELATHLKADLFVSIHVNSAGVVENANGIETYYLNGKNLVDPIARKGFLFLADSKCEGELAKIIDKLFCEKISSSQRLASNVHNRVVDFLKKKGIGIVDRGIKQSLCRIFLRNEIPTSLVEVGFLTNKQEAKRLADSRYRQVLAYGISQGIKDYIYLQQ